MSLIEKLRNSFPYPRWKPAEEKGTVGAQESPAPPKAVPRSKAYPTADWLTHIVHGADVDPETVFGDSDPGAEAERRRARVRHALPWIYCLAITLACAIVPWVLVRNNGVRVATVYSPIFLPPASNARVDPDRLGVELLGITSGCATIWLLYRPRRSDKP